MNSEHPNAKLIERFYTSFQNKDYKGMIQCYHPDINFSDAVFGLQRDAVAAMWCMLCKNATDLNVNLIDFAADDEMGIAHWEATYNFSETGRRIHNVVEAKFKFKNGKIIEHQDNWDFWKWSNMALGLVGRFLGWTPIIRNTVKRKAEKKLAMFMEETSAEDDSKYRISDPDSF